MKKLPRFLERMTASLFLLMLTGTLLLMVFLSGSLTYMHKRQFDLPLIGFLFLSVLLVIAAAVPCFIIKQRFSLLQDYTSERADAFVRVGSVLLCFAQVYLIYCYYFRTSWDVNNVLNASKAVMLNMPEKMPLTYFSRYPNNIFLVVLYAGIMKVESLFGFLDVKNGIMGIVTVQCALCVLAGFLLYKLLKRVTGSHWTAILGWLAFVALVAASPWLSIPYSDASGLIFPIAVFYLYYCTKGSKRFYLKWFGIVLLSYLGYKIKPQLVFGLVAILLVEAARLLSKKKKQILHSLRVLPAMALALITGVAIITCCMSIMRVTLDPNRQVGPTHYFMMGLNKNTDGCYYHNDMKLSDSAPNQKERTKLNMKVIRQRVRDFGPAGLAEHYMKKQLVNYNDGTFAWGREAGKNFFHIKYANKNKKISPLMKSLYYSNGTHFNLFLNFEQLIWVGTLTGSLGILGISLKKRRGSTQGERDTASRNCITAMLLTILALTAFQLLFEARARYLFCYAPIYVILGTAGWKAMFDFARSRLQRIRLPGKPLEEMQQKKQPQSYRP